MKLGLVTCAFNPCKFRTPTENFVKFYQALGEHRNRLITVILDFADAQSLKVPGAVHIQGQLPQHCLWQKECLLNHAIKLLPEEYDAVCWIDADVIYDNQYWVEDIERALEKYAVVQGFEKCTNLKDGPNLSSRTRTGIAASFPRNKNASWGMVWAARRETIADTGLLDWAITGSGDAYMVDAWTRRPRLHVTMSKPMREAYNEWMGVQAKRSGGKIGFVGHGITHLYHGSHHNRQYAHRNNLLVKHNFDPKKDIVRDGPLYRWANPECELAKAVKEWWSNRNEDV